MTQKVMSEILAGTSTTARKPGDAITNKDLLECYYRTPGAKGIVNKVVKTKWAHGFTEGMELDEARLAELQQWDIWSNVFGFAILVVEGQNIQAWPPETNGVGFTYTDFDEKGRPTKASVKFDAEQPAIPVPRGTGGDGFYPLRTRTGMPGPRGISVLLAIIDVVNIQADIFREFLSYARIHGLSHKVLKIGMPEGQMLDAATHDAYYGRFNTTARENLVIISAKDEFKYENPAAASYDPTSLLDFGDKLLSRESSLTRFHLTGDPQGHLSSSQDASANFYADVRAEQVYTLAQIIDVLKIFGATDDIMFNPPEEVTMESKMAAIAAMRIALEGLVEPEDIVSMANEYLGYTPDDDNALRVLEVEPLPEGEPAGGDMSRDEQDQPGEEDKRRGNQDSETSDENVKKNERTARKPKPASTRRE